MNKLLIYLIVVIFLSSCAVLKKEKTTSIKQTEKSEIVIDTTSKETISKAIEDKASFKIAESNTGDRDFDLAVNTAVTNILRSINFQKTSGDNSYRLYYDEKLKTLEAQISVGETRNKEISTNKDVLVEKTLEVQIEELIKKIVIPWWVYLIPIFLFRKQIFGVLAFIYPPIRGLKTLKDIVTPPNK